MYLYFLVFFAHVIHGTSFKSDEILSLPGLATGLKSKQFSGYLDVNKNKSHLHYWFVESEQNPETDPVVLWLNGGPGCSSLGGFFYEQGPFEISTDGKILNYRKYRWNRVANMLFLEAPVGVGFSYNDLSNYVNSDDQTVKDNLEAMERFFSLFPKYRYNPFYLTGESYAGIYIPTLAQSILKSTAIETYHGAKLNGIAVGNGCTGTEIGICGWYYNNYCQGLYYSYQYFLNLPFFDDNLKKNITKHCDWNACLEVNQKPITDENPILSLACYQLLDQASTQLSYINIYNVYSDCVSNTCHDISANYNGNKDKNDRTDHIHNKKHDQSRNIQYTTTIGQSHLFTNKIRNILNSLSYSNNEINTKAHRKLSTIETDDENLDVDSGPYGCIDTKAASIYLGQLSVQQAIHVQPPPSPSCWGLCSTADGFSYKSTVQNLPRDVYPYLIENIKVLIYNGDLDACVPYNDNQDWTANMGYSTAKAWGPWRVETEGEKQIGGYAVEYDVGEVDGAFEFRTVRGAGHMVPTDKPKEAFAMFCHFIGLVGPIAINDSDIAMESQSNCSERPPSVQQSVFVTLLTLSILMAFSIISFMFFNIFKINNPALPVTVTSLSLNPLNQHHQHQQQQHRGTIHRDGGISYTAVNSSQDDTKTDDSPPCSM